MVTQRMTTNICKNMLVKTFKWAAHNKKTADVLNIWQNICMSDWVLFAI